LKEEINDLRKMLSDSENERAEVIKEKCNELQQKSLKLFEIAYKKMAAEREGGSQQTEEEEKEQKEN
ncbi:hypothetical protein, partial [Salmonella sp. s54412]|uniref:hypothetical protein n=1 Tax=Salmonella sp. s54412 TaxID=3160128 RepID=UPI003754ED71